MTVIPKKQPTSYNNNKNSDAKQTNSDTANEAPDQGKSPHTQQQDNANNNKTGVKLRVDDSGMATGVGEDDPLVEDDMENDESSSSTDDASTEEDDTEDDESVQEKIKTQPTKTSVYKQGLSLIHI